MPKKNNKKGWPFFQSELQFLMSLLLFGMSEPHWQIDEKAIGGHTIATVRSRTMERGE